MTDTDPTIDGTPRPNAWKKPLFGVSFLGGTITCIITVFAVGGAIMLLQHLCADPAPPASSDTPATIVQPAPPQPHTRIEYTESEGGETRVKGNATGASMSAMGESVDLDKLRVDNAAFTLADIGATSGGGVAFSLKATTSGMFWIRMLGLAAFLGCGALAFLNFKKNPLDWHFWGGLAVGSLAGLVVLVQPEMFYIGLAGAAVAALANFWPSITAGRVLEASKNYEDFIESSPDLKARWVNFRAGMTTADKKTIDTVIKPSNV